MPGATIAGLARMNGREAFLGGTYIARLKRPVWNWQIAHRYCCIASIAAVEITHQPPVKRSTRTNPPDACISLRV